MPWIFNKWIQDTFDVPMLFQMTDDEKFLFKDLTLHDTRNMAYENALDFIALGFDPDKVVHFLMFFPFPILAWLALGRRPSGPWPALGLTLLLFLIGCALAACTEIVQQFLPWRPADPRDFSADALALALSALIVFIKMLVTGIRSARTGR